MKRLLQWPALVVPASLFILVYVGDTYKESLITAILFFTGMALSAFARVETQATDSKSPSSRLARLFSSKGSVGWWIRVSALVAGGLMYLLLSPRPYQGMQLYPVRSLELQLAVGIAITMLAWLLIKPPHPLVSLIALAVAGLSIRAAGLLQWEINPARRDMLPLIVSAVENLLSAENPYGFHQMQAGSVVPLTYPPGLWLAHLPAYLLGIDIRWTAWLADAVIVLSLGAVAIRRGLSTAGPVFLALCAYLFLPDTHWNGIYAEPHADWAVLAALSAAAMTRRPFLVGILYGVALTTRPFNIVLFPFFAVWLLRQFGFRTAFRSALMACVIAAALYLPFVLWNPDAFYVGTVRWLLEYGPVHKTWFYGKLGFSGTFYKQNLEQWLPVLQIGSIAVLAGLAAWKLKSTRSLLIFSSFAYALFVSFNAIIWMSFWIGVCLLVVASMGVDSKADAEAKKEASAGKSRRAKVLWLSFELATGVFTAVSLVILVGSLARHFSDTGREETRKYLTERLESGDTVLDLTGWRVSLLKMPYILERGELPSGVQLADEPFRAVFPKQRIVDSTQSKRIWVVERYGLFENVAGVYLQKGEGSGLFNRSDAVDFARYRVIRLDRRDERFTQSVLSSEIDKLIVRASTSRGMLGGRWNGQRWTFPGATKQEYVALTKCRFKRNESQMLYAQPLKGGTLSIATNLNGAPRFGTVLGGLNDNAPRWRMAPVKMKVRTDGKTLLDHVFPNLPGLFGATFSIPEDTDKLYFEISADKPDFRFFCFDAIFR